MPARKLISANKRIELYCNELRAAIAHNSYVADQLKTQIKDDKHMLSQQLEIWRINNEAIKEAKKKK